MIRPFDPADAAAAVELLRRTAVDWTASPSFSLRPGLQGRRQRDRLARRSARRGRLGAHPTRERRALGGFELVALGDVLDRAREIHAVYAGAAVDVLDAFVADDLRYEDRVGECLEDPDLSRAGSAVVLHEERPVSIAVLMADDRGVAANDMTGTLSAYRLRGLARLAKLATLRWAGANGIHSVMTADAVDNPGMLAQNRSLGYEQVAEQIGYHRAG